MNKQSESPSASRRTTALVVLAVVLYWIWWDSFHEASRFYLAPPFTPSGSDPFYAYLSCFMRPVGIMAGCVAVLVALRTGRELLLCGSGLRVLFCLELALHALYWIVLPRYELSALACILHAAVSACVVVNLTAFGLLINQMDMRTAVVTALCCLTGYGVASLLFSFSLNGVPLVAMGVGYGLVLAAAYALCAKTIDPARLRAQIEHREIHVATPQPLFVHLVVYGLTFGILHTLGGAIAASPYNINLPTFFAAIVAASMLAVLFLTPHANYEIWSKMRSTVFPLTVIGVQLIPLVPISDIALTVMESGELLYDAVFAIGCITLMKRTFVDPRLIVAKGLLLKSLGMALGIAWASFFYIEAVPFSAMETQVSFAVVITLLLTIATFWVGSDDRIRKIWGLRKKLTPKQYNDAVLALKCEALSQQFRLTARESETLLLLAQGRRASEIKEEKHLSINTVRSHIQRLYTKLDVHSIDSLNELIKHVEVDEKRIG